MSHMDRNQSIFLAFVGPAIPQKEQVKVILDDYELWNLKKFSFDEFIEALKGKIPPVNDNVLKNYKSEETRHPFGITQKHFEQCSWGLFLPEHIEDILVNDYSESLFLINLYSPAFLYPLFQAGDMGIMRPDHHHRYHWTYSAYWHEQNQAEIFTKEEFVHFFRSLLPQSGYGNWYLYRAQKWEREDWRLFVASRLFSNLKDYDTGKSAFEWQRESAEMGAALESLFTAGDTQNTEVIYRLTKRASVLLSSIFPDVEKDIKELYSQRSAFVHGAFFDYIAKESKHAFNNLPIPNFDLLHKQREYVRWALTGYLYLAKILKEKPTEYGSIESVIKLLEASIIDVKLREKMLIDVEVIFKLLPHRQAHL